MSELSRFKGLHGKFGGIVFAGVRRREVRLAAGSWREIVGDAVDLVEQKALLRPQLCFAMNLEKFGLNDPKFRRRVAGNRARARDGRGFCASDGIC